MAHRITDSRGWRAVAEAAGMTDVVERKTIGRRVIGASGRCGPLTVDLEFDESGWAPSVRMGGILPGLSLHRERPRPKTLRTALPVPDTETGDEVFDREVEVHGPGAAVRAILDAQTRVLARRFLSGSVDGRRITVVVSGGELQATFPRGGLSSADESRGGALSMLLDFARRLARPEDIPARLARNAGHDPEPGVRFRNLQALIRDFPDDPATRPALRVACGDEAEAIRLGAALALRDEGSDVLLEIATAEKSDDGRAAQAVTALGEDLPRARAIELLGHALRRRRLRTAQALITWLGRHGESEGFDTLAKVLAIEKGELAAAAARALAETRLPEAEEPLLQALGRDVEGLRLAVAEALGEVGTAAAIWPLKKTAWEVGDDALDGAARRAIAAIQSRITGSPGQLSLAGGEAGQLDLAVEDLAGQLSLTKPDPPESDG